MSTRSRGPRDPRTRRSDEGASTVMVAGLAGVAVLVTAAVIMLTQVATAEAVASAQADSAALAAADVLVGRAGGDPCARAAALTASAAVRLVSCGLDERDAGSVRVQVSVLPRGLGSVLGPARARARAGPGEETAGVGPEAGVGQ